jgi:aspartate aminotransferase
MPALRGGMPGPVSGSADRARPACVDGRLASQVDGKRTHNAMNDPFARASRLDAIEVSEILEIGARAAQMNAAGDDVITLGAGEPDFDTPDFVKEAAKAAMDRGETGYTALDGTPSLKQAVRAKFARDNDLEFAQEEIAVGAGAKQLLFNALMATVEPGDEVIVPTPYWTSYADIVRIAGGVPVFVPCPMETGFRLTAAALEAGLTPRTRWIILNSPSNPSGAAYTREDYRPILDVLLDAPRVGLLVDDMYEHIVYDDFDFVTPVQVEPRLRERTLTVNGVSKAYAMTGWRIGYAGGPERLIRAMAVVQSQSTSCPSSISQAAAEAALNGPQAIVDERCEVFRQRRDLVVDRLNAMPGIECPRPRGAFYTFASCEGVLGKTTPQGKPIDDDGDFCRYLLEQAKVAVVPGRAFGLSPYFRISYAASEQHLGRSLDRIETAVAGLD